MTCMHQNMPIMDMMGMQQYMNQCTTVYTGVKDGKFCPECGAVIPKTAKFCSTCGVRCK